MTGLPPTNLALINRLQKIRRAMALAKATNPQTAAAPSPAPTVTTDFDSTLATFFTYAPGSTFLNMFGGPPAAQYSGYTVQPDIVNSATLFGYPIVEFCTDAPRLQYRCYQGTALVSVNGNVLSSAGTATAAAGGEQQIVLDWAGVRLPRTYRFNCASTQGITRIGVDALSRVWAPSTDAVVRVAWDGDSYTTGNDSTASIFSYVQIASDLLGFEDRWNTAVGGTGWLNPGSYQTMRARIADVINASPDIVILAAGTNDTSYTQAQITTEVGLYLTRLRTALPNVPIVVLGAWPKSTGPAVAILAVEAGIAAAVSSFNDPLTAFIPVSSDLSGSWMFGTGYNGSGSGNTALYIDSGQIHPNNAGHQFLGYYVAAKVASALHGMSGAMP